MKIPLGKRSACRLTKKVDGGIRLGEKRKFILDLIILTIASFALCVSIKSCQISKDATKISKDSNIIANEAVESTKYHFIQINRPYLIIAPKKFEDGKFWKLDQINNQVQAIFRYELKNVGNVAAKDISLPNRLVFGPGMKIQKEAPLTFTKPGKVTIGPGDHFVVTVTTLMGYNDEETAKKNLEYLTSNKSEGVTFMLSVDYTNELEDSQKYRTFVENRIHNDKAMILRSEMVSLGDDTSPSK
jgi:hypothetical protein